MNNTINASPKPKANLAAQIVERLRQRILCWEYPPGHRFVELELCREFGVSRSPVREALRSLSENGLVEKKVNRGYSVRQLDIKEVKELYEVRLALECFAIERVAEIGLPSNIREELEKTWRDLMTAPSPGEASLGEMDRSFHETLVMACGNQMLAKELQSINERLVHLRIIDFSTPERIRETCRQHLNILERIQALDPGGARTALKENVENALNNVDTAIKEALSRSYGLPS